MRDELHDELENSAAEVVTVHEQTLKRKRKPQKVYAGLASAKNRNAYKNKGAEFVVQAGQRIRKLTNREIAELRRHIQRLTGPDAVSQPYRLSVL